MWGVIVCCDNQPQNLVERDVSRVSYDDKSMCLLPAVNRSGELHTYFVSCIIDTHSSKTINIIILHADPTPTHIFLRGVTNYLTAAIRSSYIHIHYIHTCIHTHPWGLVAYYPAKSTTNQATNQVTAVMNKWNKGTTQATWHWWALIMQAGPDSVFPLPTGRGTAGGVRTTSR